MVRFYTSLEKGRPKALALQDAQRDRIRAGSPPFHWATFEVFGDWR